MHQSLCQRHSSLGRFSRPPIAFAPAFSIASSLRSRRRCFFSTLSYAGSSDWIGARTEPRLGTIPTPLHRFCCGTECGGHPHDVFFARPLWNRKVHGCGRHGASHRGVVRRRTQRRRVHRRPRVVAQADAHHGGLRRALRGLAHPDEPRQPGGSAAADVSSGTVPRGLRFKVRAGPAPRAPAVRRPHRARCDVPRVHQLPTGLHVLHTRAQRRPDAAVRRPPRGSAVCADRPGPHPAGRRRC
jgi:hypothetical protein